MIYKVTYPKWIFKVRAANAASAVAQCDWFLSDNSLSIKAAVARGLVNIEGNSDRFINMEINNA